MSNWTQMPKAPNEEQVRDVLGSMMDTLSVLQKALGTTAKELSQHSSRIQHIGGDFDHAGQIESLQRHMAIFDRKQDDQMENIKNLLRNVYKTEIIPFVEAEIERQITERLEAQVEEEVEACLMVLVPEILQQQLLEHQLQLEEVEISLHNSEARRANSLLRSDHLFDAIVPLKKPDGTGVSELFPKDLAGLFSLSGEEAMQLVEEYGLPNVGESRERNLNRFLQHCGVVYQMTSTCLVFSNPRSLPYPHAFRPSYQ